MPRIPTYTRKIDPTGQIGAPISPSAGRTAGADGQGLENIGRALAQVGQEMQTVRDKADLSKAQYEYEKVHYDALFDLETRQLGSLEELQQASENYLQNLQQQEKGISAKLNRRVSAQFQQYANARRADFELSYKHSAWRQEAAIRANDAQNIGNDLIQRKILAIKSGQPVEDIDRQIEAHIAGNQQLFQPGELEERMLKREIIAYINEGTINPMFFDIAEKQLKQVDFAPEDKMALSHQIETAKNATARESSEQIKLVREQTANKFLLRISRMQTSGEKTHIILAEMQNALAAGNMTNEHFRILESRLLDPPQKSNPEALIKVDLALANLGDGLLTPTEARETLAEQSVMLSDEDIDSYSTLFAKQVNVAVGKGMADMTRAAHDQLVSITESELSGIMEEIKAAKEAGRKTTLENLFKSKSETRQLELDNLARFNLAFREEIQRMTKKDVPPSYEETIKAGRRLLYSGFYGKTREQIKAERQAEIARLKGDIEPSKIADEDIDMAKKMAQRRLGPGATKDELAAEMKRILNVD